MQINDFMKIPTEAEWYSELESGWRGPDGSSCSTDHMMGVRIGRTTTDYRDVKLPASLHDYRYHLGRKHGLSEHHRHISDVAYRDDCITYINRKLDGRTMISIGVARSWVRYFALRLFGWKAWRS